MSSRRTCFVPFCYKGPGEVRKMFSIPRNEKIRALWLRAIKRPDDKEPTSNARVCFKHFAEDDIIKCMKLVVNGVNIEHPLPWKLKKGAIPTLLLDHPKLSLSRVFKRRKEPADRSSEAVAKRKSQCTKPADLNVVTYTARNHATPQPCFVDVTVDEPPTDISSQSLLIQSCLDVAPPNKSATLIADYPFVDSEVHDDEYHDEDPIIMDNSQQNFSENNLLLVDEGEAPIHTTEEPDDIQVLEFDLLLNPREAHLPSAYWSWITPSQLLTSRLDGNKRDYLGITCLKTGIHSDELKVIKALQIGQARRLSYVVLGRLVRPLYFPIQFDSVDELTEILARFEAAPLCPGVSDRDLLDKVASHVSGLKTPKAWFATTCSGMIESSLVESDCCESCCTLRTSLRRHVEVNGERQLS